MKKKMYLIVKKDGRKYWTESYEKKNGFLIFKVKSLKGELIPYEVSLDVIAEISEQYFEEEQGRPEEAKE